MNIIIMNNKINYKLLISPTHQTRIKCAMHHFYKSKKSNKAGFT